MTRLWCSREVSGGYVWHASAFVSDDRIEKAKEIGTENSRVYISELADALFWFIFCLWVVSQSDS